MLWKGRQQSGNVEDRRGMSGGKIAAGGTIGTLVIALIVWLLGGNPAQMIDSLQSSGTETGQSDTSVVRAEEELAQFASVVLKDTEDVWGELFKKSGKTYREPTLVLFSGSVESACGYTSSVTGPFYCPGDEKLYIDLTFLKDLQQQLSAQGDFAVAYIIAHEVGHHVQKLLGITDRISRKGNDRRDLINMELQADFLAGVWAYHAQRTKNILEDGDIEEAMNAAAAVGDDRIQMQSQGYVVPDAFTHGTSEQRKAWFLKGFRTGDINQGDTFSEN